VRIKKGLVDISEMQKIEKDWRQKRENKGLDEDVRVLWEDRVLLV